MLKTWMTGVVGLALLAACNSEPKGEMSAKEVADEMAEVKIEPGQWEITNEVLEAKADNVPDGMLQQMVGKKTTVANCVTPEQVEKPDASFLTAQKNNDCKYEDFAMTRGRMTGKIICAGGQMPGQMEMVMDGRYQSTSYDMTADLTMTGGPGGGGMTMKSRTVGKRVGDCT